MAANAVLINSGTTSGNTVTTTAGTSTGGSGNVGVLFFSYDPGVTISTVSDSKGNTWTQRWNMTGTGNCRLACYTSENWTGGSSHTATVTFSGNAFASAALVEGTGLATSSPEDVLVSGAVTGTFNTPVSGSSRFQRSSGTLAQADEVILYCLEANTTGSNGDYTSPDLTVLYSNNDLSNFWTMGVGKIVVSSTSSQTGTLDVANRSNTSSNFGVISFKAAGGASGPTINSHPADATINDGETANFTVSATTSGGTLTYQWQVDTGGGFSNVSGGSGGTSSSYTTAARSVSDSGDLYRCAVSDDNGTTNSNSALLTVNATTRCAWFRA